MMTHLSHSDVVACLRDRLAGPLPGHTAHAEMAPYLERTDPAVISVERNAGRPAATLVLLYPSRAGTSLVLTLRQPTLRTHSGQISLPGGSLDTGETVEVAARREAWEEVGVPPDQPTLLGGLTPLYIPPSGFSVWPVVASLDRAVPFVPHAPEVASLIEVPLSELVAPDARQRRVVPPVDAEVPCFVFAGKVVWGATAMILAELSWLVRGSPAA